MFYIYLNKSLNYKTRTILNVKIYKIEKSNITELKEKTFESWRDREIAGVFVFSH